MCCAPAGSGWVAKSQTTHTGWHWHDGKTLLSGMLAHGSPALHSLPIPYLGLHLAPSVAHVHPIIHHTPNVKLITARGHHLACTTHRGNTLSIRGVRESALAWMQLMQIYTESLSAHMKAIETSRPAEITITNMWDVGKPSDAAAANTVTWVLDRPIACNL